LVFAPDGGVLLPPTVTAQTPSLPLAARRPQVSASWRHAWRFWVWRLSKTGKQFVW